MAFCLVGPQNVAQGPGDPHVPVLKISGLAAEPSGALGGGCGSGAGGAPGGQHPQCGSSQRHEPGCGGSAEGLAQPRAWAAAVALGGGRGTGTKGAPQSRRRPGDVGARAAGGERPGPRWHGAGATRATTARIKAKPSRSKSRQGWQRARPRPRPLGSGVPKPPRRQGGVPQVRTVLWSRGASLPLGLLG